MRAALAAVVSFAVLGGSLSQSGCSLVFVDGPPSNHQQVPYFNCTESRTLPIVDSILGGLSLINAGIVASESDQTFKESFPNNDPPYSRTTNIIISAAWTALFAGSAVYGFTKTNECRVAHSELAKRQMQAPYGQPGYGPQPYGQPGYPPPGQYPPGQYPQPQPGQYPPPQGQYPAGPTGTWPPPPTQPAPAPAPTPAPAPAPAPTPAPAP